MTGPVGAQCQGTDSRRGSATAVTPSSCRSGPERRTVPEGKVVYEREGQREWERPGPNRGRTGAGRASRAGLLTWGARPNQDPPRARGLAQARCRPAALPECHVRGQGPRETAALTNRERRRRERSQW